MSNHSSLPPPHIPLDPQSLPALRIKLHAYNGIINANYDRLLNSGTAIELQSFLLSLSIPQRVRLLNEFGSTLRS